MTQSDKLQQLIGNQYEGSQPAIFSFDDATNTYHFKCGNIWFHGASVKDLFTQIDKLFYLMKIEKDEQLKQIMENRYATNSSKTES
jgi:hypothetical protein